MQSKGFGGALPGKRTVKGPEDGDVADESARNNK